MEKDIYNRFSFIHKTCPLCNKNKSTSEYHQYFSKVRNKYRIGNYCRVCAKESARVRAKQYYEENKDARLKYSREYRENPHNHIRLKESALKFKRRYREELKDCYVRDRLKQDDEVPNHISKNNPELVEAKRLQIKIKRKLKTLKDGKK